MDLDTPAPNSIDNAGDLPRKWPQPRPRPKDHDRRNHGSHPFRQRVYITRLPMDVTTLEIYQNFKQFGTIVHIKILERQIVVGGSRAEIEYDPPAPQSMWPRNVFVATQRSSSLAVAKLSKLQPGTGRIESPVHKGVDYPVKTELLLDMVHFGILKHPNKMIRLASRGTNQNRPRLVLDLSNKSMQVIFPSLMKSDKGGAVRDFRFEVALDEELELWKLPDDSFILHLQRPPWFSKQLQEATAQTHAQGAKRWSIEDTWARQTDLVGHKNDIAVVNNLPVCLQKDGNVINIARWTTFKLDVLQSEENIRTDQTIQNALRDFNIDLLSGSDFDITAGSERFDRDAWSLLASCSGKSLAKAWDGNPYSRVLPFPIRYQLEVCISQGWLSEYSLTQEFIQSLLEAGPEKAQQTLLQLDACRMREWEPMKLCKDLKYRQPTKSRQLPDGCMEIRSAVVTATSVQFNSPSVEQTNRVIRKYGQYSDHFLRVRFEDDNWRGRTKLFATTNMKLSQLFHRVRRVLRHGIILGDVHYEFLAWGNSQLREHGAYFFAKAGNVTAETIRADMGAFDREKVVAKRAARMGQCFSTTRPVHLVVPTVTEHTTIPDIIVGQYNFTDGVGRISTAAAQMIQLQLDIKGKVPSAFQFRLGGCKGVLVVWPELIGVDIKVRASQFKFSSSSQELEVIRWSEFWQPFLNRQLIICLSNLGIPDSVFLRMQDQTIGTIAAALVDDDAALKALRDTVDPNSMTLSICDLVEAGFRRSKEPFVMCLLYLWRAWMLKYLKEKAKIPIRKGAFVLGCADETGSLRGSYQKLYQDSKASTHEALDLLPEIFLQYENPQTGQRQIVTGPCILARNPSLHRGDIRIVRAVDVPALRHLCDVVVMPTNGDRDLPSMCSGGDLDGDDYIVAWDPDLIPNVWNAEPFHYEAPPAKTVDGVITTDDIINFFCDYLQNDCLGRIAHAHLGAADFLDQGIQSRTCEELVRLHSMAVDYPKTGVPAVMTADLERTSWPHFMEKKRSNSYKSKKILGQLYDAVEKVAFEPKYDSPFSETILRAFKTPDHLRHKIKALKKDYDSSMQRIMARHDIKTEFEVFSTFVLSHSKAYGDFKFHEEIGNLSRVLKDQYRHALVELAGGPGHEQLAPVAVAAYQYTNEQVKVGLKEIQDDLRMDGAAGMPFISFPWLLQDTMCWLAVKLDSKATDTMTRASKPSFSDNGNTRDIQNWLANLEPEAGITEDEQLKGSNNKGDKSSAPAGAATSFEEPKPTNAMGIPDSTSADLLFPKTVLHDPLNCSHEQLKAMGLNDDMELEDDA